MQFAPGHSQAAAYGEAPLVVVTGGTGIVGTPLLRHLAELLPQHHFLLLTRRPELHRDLNVTPVFADLTDESLGLDAATRTRIRGLATHIVHCAADTRFNLPIEQARRANTQGTLHMLTLAAACRRLTQFAHVSTLYIAGKRPGPVPEAPLSHDFGHYNTYTQAKHEAEALVLERAGEIPSAIYRLSSVVDETGSSGHFRQVIRFVPRSNQVPFFPADPLVPVDLVTADWTARALATLIARHFTPGAIRHICAGADGALPVRVIMDLAFDACESATGLSLRRPTLISLADFERLSARLPAESRIAKVIEHLITFIPHLSVAQPFDCAVTAPLLEASGIRRPDVHSLLRNVFDNEFRETQVRV
ncbi:MAG: SDR family oxidoreductase [Bryobacterales bacterium]|nr:SDR family oxidoreductase [Bryobacterales bacterium]